MPVPEASEEESCLPHLPPAASIVNKDPHAIPGIQISHQSENERVLRRLVLVSYFPSGFWSRLIARMLGDDTVVQIIRGYFDAPHEVSMTRKNAWIIDWCLTARIIAFCCYLFLNANLIKFGGM